MRFDILRKLAVLTALAGAACGPPASDADDVATTEGALSTPTPFAPLTYGVVRWVSDANAIYAAPDVKGLSVVTKATGATDFVRGPALAAGGWPGPAYSYDLVQDADDVYIAGKDNIIPSSFTLWRMNKRTRATAPLFSSKVNTWSRGPLAITASEIVFYQAPDERDPKRPSAGIYVIPKAGGAPRFVKPSFNGPDAALAVGPTLYATYFGRLTKIDLQTGASTVIFDSPRFSNGLLVDLVHLPASNRILFVDRASCTVYRHDLATGNTDPLNATWRDGVAKTPDRLGSCRLAADEGGVYWFGTASAQGHQRLYALAPGGQGALVVDAPPAALGRVRAVGLDASRVYLGVDDNQSRPEGVFSIPR